jgi:predicted nucleotidyltransferase
VEQTVPEDWLPMDGDTFITREGFVFNTFGYEHPEGRVFAFIKYIPATYRSLFDIDYLDRTWTRRGQQLCRAERLYTARNYAEFLEAFRRHFPAYVYHCPFRGKEVISAPLCSIESVFIPKERLRKIAGLEHKDALQEMTTDFVNVIAEESGVATEDFGVHGSVALDMHSEKSDTDIVVYGSRNFRTVEAAIDKLVKAGKLSYLFGNRLDASRHFKGRYGDRIFMYTATRRPEEVTARYGAFKYTPLAYVRFNCVVIDDDEAMFRPAIYKITDYEPVDSTSRLSDETIPQTVVSMIGCYRNVARKSDRMRVAGMLERVEAVDGSHVFHQVVVGTGANEDEHVGRFDT